MFLKRASEKQDEDIEDYEAFVDETMKNTLINKYVGKDLSELEKEVEMEE